MTKDELDLVIKSIEREKEDLLIMQTPDLSRRSYEYLATRATQCDHIIERLKREIPIQ